jgi:two-component system response regulator DevR
MPGANADLVTLDINLPGGSGLELLPALRRMNPSARILVLSQEDPARLAPLARAAEAAGYLRKGASSATILQVASAVLAGDECFPELPRRGQT